MADKRKKSGVPASSRKTTRRKTAPLARKAGEGDDARPAEGSASKGEPRGAAKAADKGEGTAKPAARADKPKFDKPRAGPAARPAPAAKPAAPEPKPAAKAAPAPPAPPAPAAKPAPAKPEPEPAKTAPPPMAETEYAELLGPDEIDPNWDPEANAPPPGKAPPGDSRSFRRGDEFCLIYRVGSYLITRTGKVGKMGTWQVVEYPSIGAAAHAYAQEGSNLTGQGYRDLR